MDGRHQIRSIVSRLAEKNIVHHNLLNQRYDSLDHGMTKDNVPIL